MQSNKSETSISAKDGLNIPTSIDSTSSITNTPHSRCSLTVDNDAQQQLLEDLAPSPSSLSLCSLTRDLGVEFKKGPLTDGSNCWSEPPAEEFHVRSSSYLTSKIKEPSLSSLFDLVDVDVFRNKTQGRYDNFSESIESYPQFAIRNGEKRFLLVMHFQSMIYNMACTFALNNDKLAKAPLSSQILWSNFKNGTDEYRNERFKVVPRLMEAHWMLKAACGKTQPILYATKLKHRWKKTEQYLEIMCDTTSSTIASKLATMSIGSANSLTFDMALLIEGRDVEELPEHILGVFRLTKPDLKHARLVSMPTLRQSKEQLHLKKSDHSEHKKQAKKG
eukprot:Pgem_evm1s15091